MKKIAPEKIYLSENPCRDELENVWFNNQTSKKDIEYTRTDYFIEKACKFLQDRIEHDSIDYPMATYWLIDDFKKYMEESKV